MRPFLLAILTGAALSLGPLVKSQTDKKDDPKKEYKGNPAARLVHYTGMVQGVGFRAKTEQIARDFPVTGWVKNLKDGRVQLLAEGKADALDDFLKAVRTHWKENITKEESQEEKPSGKFKDFRALLN
jgi:acylphosphatase